MNKKKHLSSFSTQGTQSSKAPKVIEPLTRGFFSQLIKFEMDFYNKHYTAESLDELIQYYAKAVEYYDTIKDEISSYFIFKIQDALATKKSLTLLIEQKAKENLRKSQISSSDNSLVMASPKNNLQIVPEEEGDVGEDFLMEDAVENLSDEEDESVKEFAKRRKTFLAAKNKNVAPSFSVMKTQKQKFVNLFHKLETVKTKQTQNMHSLLKEFGNSAIGNDQMIKKDIGKQRARLQALLEEKKAKSFATQTMSASSYYNTSAFMLGDLSKENGHKKFEEVLKELEDTEDGQLEMVGLAEKKAEKNESKEGSGKENGKAGSESKKLESPSKKVALMNLVIPEGELNVNDGNGNFVLSPIGKAMTRGDDFETEFVPNIGSNAAFESDKNESLKEIDSFHNGPENENKRVVDKNES